MARTPALTAASLIDDAIPAAEFPTAYFSLYDQALDAGEEGRPYVHPDAAAWILDDFFIEVDRLSDDGRRSADRLTPDDLRTRARDAVAKLEQIAAGSPTRPGPLKSVLRLAFVSVLLVGQTVVFAGYGSGGWPAG
jgi:hypothetical protein